MFRILLQGCLLKAIVALKSRKCLQTAHLQVSLNNDLSCSIICINRLSPRLRGCKMTGEAVAELTAECWANKSNQL